MGDVVLVPPFRPYCGICFLSHFFLRFAHVLFAVFSLSSELCGYSCRDVFNKSWIIVQPRGRSVQEDVEHRHRTGGVSKLNCCSMISPVVSARIGNYILFVILKGGCCSRFRCLCLLKKSLYALGWDQLVNLHACAHKHESTLIWTSQCSVRFMIHCRVRSLP